MPRYLVTVTYLIDLDVESEEWARKDALERVRAAADQPDYVDVEVVRRDK